MHAQYINHLMANGRAGMHGGNALGMTGGGFWGSLGKRVSQFANKVADVASVVGSHAMKVARPVYDATAPLAMEAARNAARSAGMAALHGQGGAAARLAAGFAAGQRNVLRSDIQSNLLRAAQGAIRPMF